MVTALGKDKYGLYIDYPWSFKEGMIVLMRARLVRLDNRCLLLNRMNKNSEMLYSKIVVKAQDWSKQKHVTKYELDTQTQFVPA